MTQREMRALVREIRAEGEGAATRIVGHAALYEVETVVGGWYREVIRRGAFARAIREKQDVVALFNHNASQVLGRTTSGTLLLSEDDVGLKFEILPPDTTVAKDLIESMRRGDVKGASFDFSAVKGGQQWTTYNDGQLELREILDVDLFDVSVVTDPQYARAEAEVRSRRAFDDHIVQRAAVDAEVRARIITLATLD